MFPNKKYVLTSLFSVGIFLLFSLHPTTITPVTAQSNTLRVPDDYSTIGSALSDAQAGDTILVSAGTYKERFRTWQNRDGVKILGEGKNVTIIDGSGGGTVVTIESNGVLFTGFTIRNSSAYGIVVSGRGCWVEENRIEQTDAGVSVWYDGNVLSGNEIRNNTRWGVEFSGSGSLTNNQITFNGFGCYLDAPLLRLTGNNVTHNGENDIQIGSDSGGYLVNNTIGDSRMDNCYQSILRGNRLESLDIRGSSPEFYVHDIDASNLVDGNPIYYLMNQSDLVVNSATFPDAGYLAFIDSTNVTLRDLVLTDLELLLAGSTQCTITNATFFMDGTHGAVRLDLSPFNVVENVRFVNASYGITLNQSNNNSIHGNIMARCLTGIVISSGSWGNRLLNNTFCNNTNAIYLDPEATENTCYHNNFINNTHQTRWAGFPELPPLPIEANTWDNGGTEGNYWSDYSDHDLNSDGIGDSAYLMQENNQDNYPLMNPTADLTILLTPTAHAGMNQTVDQDTLVALNGSASWGYLQLMRYNWTFLDGTIQTLSGKVVSYQFTTPGTYVVTLTVVDALGNNNTNIVFITVEAGPRFPWLTIIGVGGVIGILIVVYFRLIRRSSV